MARVIPLRHAEAGRLLATVGSAVVEERHRRGMTQREFAPAVALTQVQLTRIESGQFYRLPLYWIYDLAQHFSHRSVDALCDPQKYQQHTRTLLREERVHMLLRAYAQLSDPAQALLVSTALDLAALQGNSDV